MHSKLLVHRVAGLQLRKKAGQRILYAYGRNVAYRVRESRKTAVPLGRRGIKTASSRSVKSFECGKNRLKVAVDVDEVLGQFLKALNKFVLEQYGMDHDIEDYHVYHFATIWGCSQEISTNIVHEFFKSEYFKKLPLVPGAFETLCEMQEWCELHVVTSRQHVIRNLTVEWLSSHYPGIFSSVRFGNHFSKEGATKKKSDLCKEIEADVLIDDNPVYAEECALSGIHVILYNEENRYPWSRLGDLNERISQATCWSDVPRILRGLYAEPALPF